MVPIPVKKEASVMKRSHICPKCGGRDILRVPGKSGAYGAGQQHPDGLYLFFRRAGPPVCLLRLRLFGRMDRRRRPGTPERKNSAECSGRKYDDIPSENRAAWPGPNRLGHRPGTSSGIRTGAAMWNGSRRPMPGRSGSTPRADTLQISQS